MSKLRDLFSRIQSKMDSLATKESNNDSKQLILAQQSYAFYHIKVDDGQVEIDGTDAIYFDDAEDLSRKLPSLIRFLLDEYVLEELIEGDLKHITIKLGPENFQGEDIEAYYG